MNYMWGNICYQLPVLNFFVVLNFPTPERKKSEQISLWKKYESSFARFEILTAVTINVLGNVTLDWCKFIDVSQ